ncbi:MAG: type II toxin-antitoxin system VapC family toxin [Devosia sp.]
MTLIVDASVAVKWAVEEEGHEDAVALFAAGHEFLVPDFLLIEVGNVLWKKLRRGQVAAEQAHASLKAVGETLSDLVHSWSLAERALEISIELDHPMYDCIYLAAAEEYAATLVTADKRLLKAIAGGPFASLAAPLAGSPL